MFRHSPSRRLRRELLLEQNQSSRKKPKKLRNKALNFLARFFFLRQLGKLFRASILVSMIFVVMAFFVFFAVFSPYFHLKKISIVRDNPNLDVQQIERSLEGIYGQNLLFLSDSVIREKLFADFPEFRSVEVVENWPSEIELRIVVSPPRFNLLNTETANFSVVSEDGVVLQEEPNEDLPTIKVFQYEKPIQVRQKFLTKRELDKIITAELFLKEETDLPLHATHLLYVAHELHLISRQEMEIWIDLSLPVEDQLRKLLFSRDQIGLSSRNFEHIDLRIPKQIFWKWK